MILALKKNSTPAQEETLLAYLHQMGVTAAKETCRGCLLYTSPSPRDLG